MSVGISLIAKKPRPGFFGRFSREADWHAVIKTAVLQIAKTLDTEFLVVPTGDPKSIMPHYCEEWLDIEISKDSIILSSKTSSCGPGYHAFIVDVIDSLESNGLRFEEDGENVDETGYFASRDFGELQRQHASYLKALAAWVQDNRDKSETGLRMSLPVDAILPAPLAFHAQTPSGFMPYQSFIDISEAEGSKLTELASDWFAWWDRKHSAQDWLRIGKQLMWYQVPWHVPADGYERHVMEAALECCRRARVMDYSIELPQTEIQELEKFLSPETPDTTAPVPGGIGYRRRLCSRWIGSGWTCEIPGYWYDYSNDKNWGFCFGDVYLSVSTYKATADANADAIELTDLSDDIATIIEESGAGFKMRLTRQKLPSDAVGYLYALQAASLNRLLLIVIEGNDDEFEKTIPAIARSLKATKPGQ